MNILHCLPICTLQITTPKPIINTGHLHLKMAQNAVWWNCYLNYLKICLVIDKCNTADLIQTCISNPPVTDNFY